MCWRLIFFSLLFITAAPIEITHAQNGAQNGIDEVFKKPNGEKSWGSILADFFGYAGYEKSYALVIGISVYDDASLSDLPTRNDPIRVKDYLLDEAGFDHVHLLTEEKVTDSRVSELMVDEFPELLDKNDRFIFYWSGHGVTRGVGLGSRGYLPLKISGSNKYSSMISMQDIKRWDGLIVGDDFTKKQALYLLDTCFSGLAGSAVKSNKRLSKLNLLSQKSSHLLTAGTNGQQTIALDSIGGSVFTHAILEGLRGYADSANAYPRDGVVTLNELKGYVESRVDQLRLDAGWQDTISPQMRDLRSSDGEFFFMTASGKEDNLSARGLVSTGNFKHGIPISMSMSSKEPLSPTSLELSESTNAVDKGLIPIIEQCQQGNEFSCHGLGDIYGEGENGVEQDSTLARHYYKKGCDQGDSISCAKLGSLYRNGIGGAKNETLAVEAYQVACDSGISNICNNLGAIFHKGIGGERNLVKALSLYRHACDLGESTGCDNFKMLNDALQ